MVELSRCAAAENGGLVVMGELQRWRAILSSPEGILARL